MRAPFTEDHQELLTRAREIFQAILEIPDFKERFSAERAQLWAALADIFEDLGLDEESDHCRGHMSHPGISRGYCSVEQWMDKHAPAQR